MKITIGKHKGKELSELNLQQLMGLRGAMQAIRSYRQSPLMDELNREIQIRQNLAKGKRPKKRRSTKSATEIHDRERFAESLRSRTDDQLVRLKDEMQAAKQLVLVGMIRDEVQRRVAVIQAEETWMTSERGRARDKHHLGKFYSEEVPETKRA